MAALDPTQFEPFYKIFPELNAQEIQAVVLDVIGLSHKDIASIKARSKAHHYKFLARAKTKLELDTYSALRAAALVRILLNLTGSTLFESLKIPDNTPMSECPIHF